VSAELLNKRVQVEFDGRIVRGRVVRHMPAHTYASYLGGIVTVPPVQLPELLCVEPDAAHEGTGQAWFPAPALTVIG